MITSLQHDKVKYLRSLADRKQRIAAGRCVIEGARLIATGVHLPSAGTAILIVVLAILGIVVQASIFRRGRRPT
jgi:hypothetical protein